MVVYKEMKKMHNIQTPELPSTVKEARDEFII
jgi:hypothetical protein